MSSEHGYVDYLEDILDAAEKAMQFIRGMTYEQFISDSKTTFAVIRALEVIGEATKRIPQSVRDKYSEVSWTEMAGMRDKLIHDYTSVSLEVVWKTASEDLPVLEPVVKRMLAEVE